MKLSIRRHLCRALLPVAGAALLLTLSGCGKAMRNDSDNTLNVTSDAYWMAFQDGKNGNWIVLANGYTTNRREVRSFSISVENGARTYAVALACLSDDPARLPDEVQLFYSSTTEIGDIAWMCKALESTKYALLTGEVVGNSDALPKLGEERVTYAGPMGQVEDFRAFADVVRQSTRFDLVSVWSRIDLATNALIPYKYSIIRDNVALSERVNIEVDFANSKFAFDADTRQVSSVNVIGEPVAGEFVGANVDFKTLNGQSLVIARNARGPGELATPLSYYGIPDLRATKKNPITQLPGEGHRAYTYSFFMSPNNTPIITRFASTMFRQAPDNLQLYLPDHASEMGMVRESGAADNVFAQWQTTRESHYGAARLWYFTVGARNADASEERLNITLAATRGWIGGNADSVDQFKLNPGADIVTLPGWNPRWKIAAQDKLLVQGRSVFAAEGKEQAIADWLFHFQITNGLVYGDNRSIAVL